MKKIFPAHGTDFALRKESSDWNRTHTFLHHCAVMVTAAKETFSSATATKEKRTQRWILVMLGAIRCEKDMQVIACGLGVTQLELNRLAFLHVISNGDGARLLVRSDKIAHQKISAFEPAPMFIDGDADM